MEGGCCGQRGRRKGQNHGVKWGGVGENGRRGRKRRTYQGEGPSRPRCRRTSWFGLGLVGVGLCMAGRGGGGGKG